MYFAKPVLRLLSAGFRGLSILDPAGSPSAPNVSRPRVVRDLRSRPPYRGWFWRPATIPAMRAEGLAPLARSPATLAHAYRAGRGTQGASAVYSARSGVDAKTGWPRRHCRLRARGGDRNITTAAHGRRSTHRHSFAMRFVTRGRVAYRGAGTKVPPSGARGSSRGI